jgi:putative transposase
MKRKTYSQEQIIRILKEREAGVPASEIIRKHGIANGTLYRWKSKYGGMDVCEAKRLRELEAENAKLKKLLAETMLEKTAVEDALHRKW